jgi:hypothetical protein
MRDGLLVQSNPLVDHFLIMVRCFAHLLVIYVNVTMEPLVRGKIYVTKFYLRYNFIVVTDEFFGITSP